MKAQEEGRGGGRSASVNIWESKQKTACGIQTVSPFKISVASLPRRYLTNIKDKRIHLLRSNNFNSAVHRRIELSFTMNVPSRLTDFSC